MPGKVVVVGLRDFNKELKALAEDGHWQKELRAANKAVAEVVAEAAQQRAVVLEGDWQSSITARATATRAQVAFGGAGAPHGAPLEFGWPSRPGWRAQPAVYPAIGETTDQVVELYGDKIEELAARAFPD